MTDNRKRNKLVASVVAGVSLTLVVGVVVFIETYRTLQGHSDGAALTSPSWIGFLAAFTGAAIAVSWRRRRHNR
jgi:hypothetical protein